MKEENSSSLEVNYSIASRVVNYKKRMMLIPFGYPFNFDFMEKASDGDVVSLANGTLIKIIHKSILNINSSIAENIAWALYNMPMKDVFAFFADEFGLDNIQNEEIVLLTYDIL